MATTIDIRELADRFAEIVEKAGERGEVIVTDRGTPKAILLPFPARKSRLAGLHLGAIQAHEDFDAPLPDEFWTGRP